MVEGKSDPLKDIRNGAVEVCHHIARPQTHHRDAPLTKPQSSSFAATFPNHNKGPSLSGTGLHRSNA
jgi:hypothetical protein